MAEGSRNEGRRHASGPRAIAATLPRIAGPALRRRGFAGGGEASVRVVTDWAEIVGAALARDSLPERLTFPRGAESGGVLRIRAAGPLALELQHLEPLVIERINRYFGYRAVAKLSFVQAPVSAAPRRTPPALPPEPTGPEAARLAASLAGIEDEALRGALAGLGRAVLARRTPVDKG
jgi:hypothetical protein